MGDANGGRKWGDANRKSQIPESSSESMSCDPIVFGTDVACMRIVSDAELICESRDAETWLRRG